MINVHAILVGLLSVSHTPEQAEHAAREVLKQHARQLARTVEDLPLYQKVPDCPHCPDGHTPPDRGQAWSAWVADVRDGDGQPMQIIVARAAGAHVAESDAQWIRMRLNAPA